MNRSCPPVLLDAMNIYECKVALISMSVKQKKKNVSHDLLFKKSTKRCYKRSYSLWGQRYSVNRDVFPYGQVKIVYWSIYLV